MKEIKKDIFYVGVNDHEIDLFEGHYIVENGMAYNSFVIKDNKIAVTDTVDAKFFDEWINGVKEVVGNDKIDYLIIHHMEPDHSANISKFLEAYPETVLVGNEKTFAFLDNFFRGLKYNKLVVKENEVLDLGNHKLQFVFAPMVHWPEVMMSYDLTSKCLFSADAFGKFGALDVEEEWACEARRYYFGIVGKYGMQVQMLFKKIAALDIQTILPLHGPLLTENLSYYLDLYNTWSSYGVESEGVCICYTSVYGHTKEAVTYLKDLLEAKGIKVAFNDLARSDEAECIEDAFRYAKLVVASTTYNMDVFPYMKSFLWGLSLRGFSNKKIAYIENGSWALNAANVMKSQLENCKNLEVLSTISIKSSMSEENKKEIEELANKLI